MLRPALAFIAAALVAAAAPAAAAPAIWEVRDDDSSIWLFGSIGNLPADLEWRTPLFDDVLAGARKVVFEADASAAGTTAAGATALSSGIYADGTLLTDLVDEDTELRLRQAADVVGVPFGMVLAMRPWFAARALHVGTQVAYGFGDLSLASQLQSGLPPDRLQFLGTTEGDMALLDSISDEEQLAMLAGTLQHLPAIPKSMSKLMSNWAAGTPENAEDAFVMEAGGFSWAAVEKIVHARTLGWLPGIEAMMARDQENLIIVDTPNLLGQSGLLHLLGDAGYIVERVQ